MYEAKFKSEVVKYACDVYKAGVRGDAGRLLGRCLDNVNAIGPETLREVASNAADGIYAAELEALVTELLAA